MTIPIVELGPVSASLSARSNQLFEQLGGWVTSTSEPELQRLFATACHRHAWHADLWELRTPRIAGIDFGAAPAQPLAIEGDDARRDWYRAQLAELVETLARLDTEGDVELDPSTARTVQLVGADIADVQSRLG